MEWVVRETRRRRRVGKKRCRKALSGERDPLTKVRWAHVTKLPLHLASEQPHPYTLYVRHGTVTMFYFYPLPGPKKIFHPTLDISLLDGDTPLKALNETCYAKFCWIFQACDCKGEGEKTEKKPESSFFLESLRCEIES